MSRTAWARANRRTDTKPELALRSELHRRGFRFRKDLRLDLGTINPRPDIVFTRAKVAVFVDGCFWHCCPDHGRPPTQNTGYWGPKLARNVERDRLYDSALREAGWSLVRVWEHVPVTEAADVVERVCSASRLTYPMSAGRRPAGEHRPHRHP
ncbi:very short patch repair endonuclease [Nocardioides pantholopis]|uniref:very short patch repair endonuclease n=1 Tax=Nocardioides pantholopis TaxID=2483798 RepID=UPI001F14CBB8|nr:very short patch repair endonuclease [Nocardioides pantholopis]